MKLNKDEVPDLICPKCKSASLLIRDELLKYTDSSCNWIQFRMVCDIELSISDIQSLVTSGKTSLIKGFY